ncbi:MAG TPA: ATP-binding cassette domain-containing protein [Kineosporiaceae bacterium]|nr:ATP-binding cassette domain-containing protein [Kineosporiaceae bacterium]
MTTTDNTSQQPAAPGIEAIGLSKAYRGLPVLTGVDLLVPGGSVFALLGPNGAGKTTTVRILATLIEADSGQAQVAGFDVRTQRRQVRRSLSLTGQYAAVDELQTGAENLRMMGALAGLSRSAVRRRTGELLARFDLVQAGDRRVGTYSGGMRRRLDLAAGLVVPPAVVFLDEPTTGLDPRSRQQMWQVIAELGQSGVTVFLTTQYLDEADRLADRIAIIDGGRVVAEGTADELKQRIGEQRLTLTLTDPTSFDVVGRHLGDRATSADRSQLEISVPTDGSGGHVRALLDELDPDRSAIERFAVHGATLDDVFLALTGHPTTTQTSPSTHTQETADV